MDADDFIRCPGCDRSLCLLDCGYADTCLECGALICWDCLEKHGIRQKPTKEKRKNNEPPKQERWWSEPEDFIAPHKMACEDCDDEECMLLFEQFGEPGFTGGCPFCNQIPDNEILEYLIQRSGKTKKEIEKEIRCVKNQVAKCTPKDPCLDNEMCEQCKTFPSGSGG